LILAPDSAGDTILLFWRRSCSIYRSSCRNEFQVLEAEKAEMSDQMIGSFNNVEAVEHPLLLPEDSKTNISDINY
jgi:hypothetical protein